MALHYGKWAVEKRHDEDGTYYLVSAPNRVQETYSQLAIAVAVAQHRAASEQPGNSRERRVGR